MEFHILTIFPRIFDSFAREALIARAIKKNIISIHPHNLRRWASDSRGTVDDRPYGGGPGMVLMAEPIARAVAEIKRASKRMKTVVILFSAKGKLLEQKTVKRLLKFNRVIMICGRYEGVDERVARSVADKEISIGKYIIFGGEVPAMVLMEAMARLLPGAIGAQASLAEESWSAVRGVEKEQLTRFIEYPHYTRPEVITVHGKRERVPRVLLSGDHRKIEAWRRAKSRSESAS